MTVRNNNYFILQNQHCAATGRLLLIVFCVLFHVTRLLGDDKDVRSTFLKEYKPHAANLQKFYAIGHAKCVHTYHRPNGKQRVHTMDVRYSGSNYILESVSKSPDKAKPDMTPTANQEATARNARYQFTLDQKGDKLYVLANLLVYKPDTPSGFCFMASPIADYQFGHQTFLEMPANNGIEFLEFQDSTWQNKPAKKLKVRLTSHYGTAMQKTAEMIVTYFFSPQDGWICQGMQGYAANKPSSMREEIYSYGQKEGEQFPALKRCEEWLKDPGNPAKAKLSSVTDITEFEHHVPYPDSDFTLTAFGLPEPYGVVWKKGPPWYLWFAVLAVAFLSLGWYLRRRVQRREAGLVGPSPT